MEDDKFQQQVVAQFKALDDFNKSGVTVTLLMLDDASGEWVPTATGTSNSKNTVTPQKVLNRLAIINNYLEEHPEAATSLAWSLAALHGPKAVIQLAAEQALGATDLGQQLNAYVAELQYEFGKKVAEKIESRDLFEEEAKDSLLIGGGNLMVSIITGALPTGGRRGGTEIYVAPKRGGGLDEVSPQAGKPSSGFNNDASQIGGKTESPSMSTDGLAIERVQAGSKGNWDRAVNGDLKPRTAYELSNGHVYVTDSAGRVSSVNGKLDLSKMDRNKYQQCQVGHCGNPGDDGGHLIASSLGGAGDKINIVPQASTLNRGDWKAMENSLRKELEAGKNVSLKIDVDYPVGSVRPSGFKVYAMIGKELKIFDFVQ